MKLKRNVASFKTTCMIGHRAQDSCDVRTFDHAGKTVVVAALSDGVSGDYENPDYQPELGAKWLCNQFVAIAQALYVQGLRGEELGRSIVLRLGTAIRDYKPQSKKSTRGTFADGSPGEFWDELAATLMGFVADDEYLIEINSGDGYTLLNEGKDGKTFDPKRKNHPVKLFNHPEELWPETMDQVFDIIVTDIRTVRTFVVASDGITTSQIHEQVVLDWAKTPTDPDRLVTELARVTGVPKRYRDDITVIALSVSQ